MSENPELLIRARNLELTYRVRKQLFSSIHKEVHALQDVSFDLYKGNKLGILGRNGAGKSTLFKILTGIFAPDAGELAIVPETNVQLLSLGVGFEGNLTGRENAVLNGMLIGRSRAYMLERVEAIKEFSELGDFYEMPVYTYSSGMNTRLGFSVALEAAPDVLLIDEVLGVGDAHFAEKSKQALKERFAGDSTVILVSHNHGLIESICDRAVWIESGISRAEGAVGEVIPQYLQSLES